MILIYNKFLIDSNCLITPKHQYYAFDLTSTFWEELGKNIEKGNILILDKVFDEVIRGKDELSEWLKKYANYKINYDTEEILNKYKEIIFHIKNSSLYKSGAESEWSKSEIADGFLVATACVHNYKIITNERANQNLNSINAAKTPKIPNIAKHFNVDCVNLFDVMRELNFKRM